MIENGVGSNCDIYVAAHHGSKYSSGTAFLQWLQPKDVMISCGVDNEYGHPAPEVLRRIEQCHSNIYRTDEQGEILVTGDGTGYTVETISGDEENLTDTTGYYVLNTRSMKIHMPDCDSVSDISKYNQAFSSKTVEALEAEGYTACQNCLP
jgi:hypothetical protein